MSLLKSLAGAVLVASFCSSALAQDFTQVPVVFKDELASTCPPGVSACHRYDYATTTVYTGSPHTRTTKETVTTTTVHTKTTTSIVAVVITQTRDNIGICNIMRTVTAPNPETIDVTQIVTSVEHRVTSVPTTTTSTYYEYVDNVVDCIITVQEDQLPITALPVANSPEMIYD